MAHWLVDIQDALTLIAVAVFLLVGVAGALGGLLYLVWGRNPRA